MSGNLFNDPRNSALNDTRTKQPTTNQPTNQPTKIYKIKTIANKEKITSKYIVQGDWINKISDLYGKVKINR